MQNKTKSAGKTEEQIQKWDRNNGQLRDVTFIITVAARKYLNLEQLKASVCVPTGGTE